MDRRHGRASKKKKKKKKKRKEKKKRKKNTDKKKLLTHENSAGKIELKVWQVHPQQQLMLDICSPPRVY
jgi:hypothetical protein